MFLLNLNKTGVWTMLVLLLFGLSLYPACGRPSFPEADEDTGSDDHEEDEDHVDVQDEDDGEEDESDEEFDSTTKPLTAEECAQMAKDEKKKDDYKKLCVDTGIVKKPGGGAVDAPGEAAGGKGAKDEYDD